MDKCRLIFLVLAIIFAGCKTFDTVYFQKTVQNHKLVVDSLSSANNLSVTSNLDDWRRTQYINSDSTITSVYLFSQIVGKRVYILSVNKTDGRDSVTVKMRIE